MLVVTLYCIIYYTMLSVAIIIGVLGFAAASPVSKDSSGVVFCYYGSWANQRPGSGNFGIADLPLHLCTHIFYSFIYPNADGSIYLDTQETVNGSSNALADFTALKSSYPNVKYLVAIGGWTEGSANFSTIVNNDTLRATFVENVVNFLDEYNLDGFDLDWEYPSQRDGSQTTDKVQFGVLTSELKAAFAESGYLLTAAVAVTQSNIDLSYDVATLVEHLDYFNLMTYDLHGTWDSVTGVNAPLYPQLTDSNTTNLNVNYSINLWIENGVDPSKLVVGLGNYGKTFTLTSLNDTSTGAPFNGSGVAGPYLQEAGAWSYYEICEDQLNNPDSWNITEVTGNYVYANKDLFWVGYDNADTIFAKGARAKELNLAGIMFWAVDLDDFNGLCGDKFPLINAGIAGYKSVKNNHRPVPKPVKPF